MTEGRTQARTPYTGEYMNRRGMTATTGELLDRVRRLELAPRDAVGTVTETATAIEPTTPVAPPSPPFQHTIIGHAHIDTTGTPTAGDVLTWTGTIWRPSAPTGGGGGITWPLQAPVAPNNIIKDSGGTTRLAFSTTDPHVAINPVGVDASVQIYSRLGVNMDPSVLGRDTVFGASWPTSGALPFYLATFDGTRAATGIVESHVAVSMGALVDAAGFPGQSVHTLTIGLSGTNSGAGAGDSGTATATAALVITDSTKSWAASQWVGGWITIDGQVRVIANNSATTITVWRAFDPVPGNVAYTVTFGSHSQLGGIKFLPNLGATAKVGYFAGIHTVHSANQLGNQVGEMVFLDIGDWGDAAVVKDQLFAIRIGSRGGRDGQSYGQGKTVATYGIYIDGTSNVVNVSSNRWSIGTTATPQAVLDVTGGSSTPGVGVSGRVMRVSGTLVEQASGTHALLAGLEVVAPTITGGAATVTDAATLYVSGAPTATVTGANYGLWVAGGVSRFGGRVELNDVTALAEIAAPGGDPTADTGWLYAKDVGGQSHPFWEQENGTTFDLTAASVTWPLQAAASPNNYIQDSAGLRHLTFASDATPAAVVSTFAGDLRVLDALFVNTTPVDSNQFGLTAPVSVNPAGTGFILVNFSNTGATLGKTLATYTMANWGGTLGMGGFNITAGLGFNFSPQFATSGSASTMTTFYPAQLAGVFNTGAGGALTIGSTAGLRILGPILTGSGGALTITGDHVGLLVAKPGTTGTATISGNFIGVDILQRTASLGVVSGSVIGLRVALMRDMALQLSDTGGTAPGGITWGAVGGLSNLYRSAADELKTDGKLWVVGELEIDGDLNHNGPNVGFFGAAPVGQAAAYTQTYATADRTHANFTSADIAAFTGGVIGFLDAAERDNVRTQFNLLRADLADLKQLANSIIDDMQALGVAA